MRVIFNRRAFVSLVILVFFSVILTTSVLMFMQSHTALIAMLHTGVGFILLAFIGWHLLNNFASLKTYFKWTQGKNPALAIALPCALALGALVLLAGLTQSAPFASLYAWGNQLRAGSAAAEAVQFHYVRADKIPAAARGNKLAIDLRKGEYFRYPQYAIWLETLDGQFIQPLFVTQKLALHQFNNKVTLRTEQVFNTDISNLNDNDWNATFASEQLDASATGQRTRPESLPVFLHQRATQPAVQAFVAANPAEKPAATSAIDAYAGATLLDNFLLSTQALQPLPAQFRVRLEINQSFDFNEFYSSDRFPNDPIYSGDGYNGQPSVIYQAVVDTSSTQRYYPMVLIGRGHHSGADGAVYQDLDNLTSAKQLVDRIIVEIPAD